MSKKTISKRRMRRDCWDLDDSFFKWLLPRLKIFLKEGGKIIDFNYLKFVYKDKEYTQEELIKIMIRDLERIKLMDNVYEQKYEELCLEILEIWKIVFFSMWW